MNNAEHVEADVEHANLLLEVAANYSQTEEGQRAIVRGAGESLITVDRVTLGIDSCILIPSFCKAKQRKDRGKRP